MIPVETSRFFKCPEGFVSFCASVIMHISSTPKVTFSKGTELSDFIVFGSYSSFYIRFNHLSCSTTTKKTTLFWTADLKAALMVTLQELSIQNHNTQHARRPTVECLFQSDFYKLNKVIKKTGEFKNIRFYASTFHHFFSVSETTWKLSSISSRWPRSSNSIITLTLLSILNSCLYRESFTYHVKRFLIIVQKLYLLILVKLERVVCATVWTFIDFYKVSQADYFTYLAEQQLMSRRIPKLGSTHSQKTGWSLKNRLNCLYILWLNIGVGCSYI